MKEKFLSLRANTLVVSLLLTVLLFTTLHSKQAGEIFRSAIEPESAFADQLIHKAPANPAQGSDNFNSLYEDMLGMRREMNRLFRESFDRFPEMREFGGVDMGHVNIRDDGDRYVIAVDLPGIDKSKLDLRINGDRLRISAVRTEALDEEKGNAVRRERQIGQISRSIELPGPVERTQAHAKYENGVLTVTALKDKTNFQDSDKIPVE